MRGGLALSVGGLGILLGCVSVTPYAEIAARLPADRLLTVDGRRVYVEDRGAGEPVILLHGFGGSSYSWRHVGEELASEFRVVAIDLAGFGFSERPRSKGDYTRYAQGELVLAVAAKLGLEDFHVVGHSYGGSVSVALALRAPERIRSLVLVDSAAPEYPQARRSPMAALRPLTTLFVRTKSLRRANVEKSLEDNAADPSTVSEEMIDEYWRRLTIEGSARAFWGLTVPMEDPQGELDLGELEVPTLLVWGSEDHLVPVDGARRSAEAIPAHRFVVIEGAGHSPMEEKPGEVAALLRRFLRGGLAAVS